jgi:hypothetical protein
MRTNRVRAICGFAFESLTPGARRIFPVTGSFSTSATLAPRQRMSEASTSLSARYALRPMW